MNLENLFSFSKRNKSQSVFVIFQKQNEPENVFFTLQKQNEPQNNKFSFYSRFPNKVIISGEGFQR